jgi:hypothetical protein
MIVYEAKIIVKLLYMNYTSLPKHFTLAARTFEHTKITSLCEGQTECIKIDTDPMGHELVQKCATVSLSGITFLVYK